MKVIGGDQKNGYVVNLTHRELQILFMIKEYTGLLLTALATLKNIMGRNQYIENIRQALIYWCEEQK